MLYDGYESAFEFRPTKSHLAYEFELLAFNENNLIIDRKLLTIDPLPDESKNFCYSVVVTLFMLPKGNLT